MAKYVIEELEKIADISDKQKMNFNYQIYLQSAINELKIKHTMYKKAIIDYFGNTWYDDNAMLCCIGDMEAQKEKIKKYRSEVLEAKRKIELIKDAQYKLSKDGKDKK